MVKSRPQYEKFLSLIVDKLDPYEEYSFTDLEKMGKEIGLPKTTIFDSKNIAILDKRLVEKEGLYYKQTLGAILPGTTKNISFVLISDGNSKTSLGRDDIIQKWKGDKRQKFPLPNEISDIQQEIIDDYKNKSIRDTGRSFFDGTNVRLHNWHSLRNSGKQIEQLELEFMETSYFDFIASNKSLDYMISDGIMLREKFAQDPYNLSGSNLSNKVSTNMVVCCEDDENKVVFTRRGNSVTEYPNTYHAPVAGGLNISEKNDAPDLDENGIPDVFLGAEHEAKKEINLDEKYIRRIVFFGVGRDLNTWEPQLIGAIFTNRTFSELNSMFSNRRDKENRSLNYYDLSIEKSRNELKHLVYDNDEWVPCGRYIALNMLRRNDDDFDSNQM